MDYTSEVGGNIVSSKIVDDVKNGLVPESQYRKEQDDTEEESDD